MERVLRSDEPGIGKTARLTEGVARGQDRKLQILTTVGVESEAPLPFAEVRRQPGSDRSPGLVAQGNDLAGHSSLTKILCLRSVIQAGGIGALTGSPAVRRCAREARER